MDNFQDKQQEGGLLRKVLVILVPILVILAGVAGFAIMQATKPKPEVTKRANPTLAVMATQAISDTVTLDVTVQGQTRPRTEIDLVPQVGGKVIYVSPQFVSGGAFKKGDVFLRLEEADYNVAVIRAEASVARAQQVIVREKAESEIARQDWAELGEGDPSDLTLRKPQMAEADANLLSAMADLNNAKLQLSRTRIVAPFNGRIRETFVDIGQFTGPGTRLAKIFSTDIIEVPLSLTDADLTRMNVPIAYTAPSREAAPDVILSTVIAGKRRVWSGKIMRTDASYNPQTRAISAIAEVVDPYGKGASTDGVPMAPGLFVDAEITGLTLKASIVIPRDALRPEDKVYVVDDKGKATSRDVIVLDTNAQRAVLQSGVEPGELVITSPLERSQLNLTFKALDANDATIVLVEPPKEKEKPKEEKVAEANEKKDKEKRGIFGRKKKDKDADTEKKDDETSDESSDDGDGSGSTEGDG